MLRQDSPDDYVVATGRPVSTREFCELAFGMEGLNYQDHVRVDPKALRPAEVDYLRGDAAKARRVLGWRPETTLEEMVREMLDADLTHHRERMRN